MITPHFGGISKTTEVASRPLRFREIVAGFTNNRRAFDTRGDFALGKTAMIFKGFPRFRAFDPHPFFCDEQVRTGRFQEIPLGLDSARTSGQKMASLLGFDERIGPPQHGPDQPRHEAPSLHRFAARTQAAPAAAGDVTGAAAP